MTTSLPGAAASSATSSRDRPSTASVATVAASGIAITGPQSRNRFEPCGAIIIDSQKLTPAKTGQARRSSRVAPSTVRPHSTYQGCTTGPRKTTASSDSPSIRTQPARPARSHSQNSTTAVTICPPSRTAAITGSWYVTKLGTPRSSSMSMPIAVGTETQVSTWLDALSWSIQPKPSPVSPVSTTIESAATTPVRRQALTSAARPDSRAAQTQARNATATAAGALTSTAAEQSTTPTATQRSSVASIATVSPATTSPIMSASLWPPATKCTSTSGLAMPSQTATRGSPPAARASRGR